MTTAPPCQMAGLGVTCPSCKHKFTHPANSSVPVGHCPSCGGPYFIETNGTILTEEQFIYLEQNKP